MVAQVDAEDFYQYVARKEETIWRSFQDLDLDGTGEVDDEELLQALRLRLLGFMGAVFAGS